MEKRLKAKKKKTKTTGGQYERVEMRRQGREGQNLKIHRVRCHVGYNNKV